MKQILIISGKGGTGKTILTGAFAALVKNKVMVDCDVDAADLHLLLSPTVNERNDFKSGKTAFIDNDKCAQCRKCIEMCRYEAISDDFIVDPIACEGCSFCSHICPADAIEMQENESGEWYISDTRFGALVHARLGIAEENSGKLVSLVRQKAKELAEKQNCEYVIIDGPPGIGCPVIASLSGINCALVVTEPTLSGLHDAKRVIEVAQHFKVPIKLVINKFTLNLEMTQQIKKYCEENNISIAGKIPFDKAIVESIVQGKTLLEHSYSKYKELISDIWKELS
ncbi:MAG: ATP-binding protein [Candidatus Omnitrophica bacterium]|nr:ATP-binding protein [Candidatus Omnitrophota bacterium]MBU1997303.1 ATP-binding protein [Candidatus Omnitrophota bacterium]MBU4332908.1 ATP-binding protein [Candidatus Omnitrophota bacterium]